MLIKAGTYRFNDTIPFEGVDAIWQDLVYTVIGAIILDPSTFTVVYNADEVITFNNLTVIEDGDADRIVFNWDDQNAEQPDGTVIVVPDIIYNNSSKWDTCYTYAKGFQIDMPSLKGYGQTITIPNDTEVSAEFYEWFTANAVEQKQISGKLKFNDVLTRDLRYGEYVVNFSFIAERSGYLINCQADRFTIENTTTGAFRMHYTIISMNPDLGASLPLVANAYSYYPEISDSGWLNSYGEGIKTIDFGTEPQTVSADFYNWLTANAVPVMASITHNGSTLAELFPGQTATLKCKGMKMEDDVVVEVAELPETEIPEPKLQEKTATENGEYFPDEGYDGLSKVIVNVEKIGEVEKIVYVGMDYDENVKAVNHRGYSTVAPENTLPAYVLSKKNGFNYVEADISFTSDGVPVLLHDSTIDRTSDGSGSISAMTYADVSKYDFGSWKSADYAGTKIPTFAEFIKLCKNLCLHPYIELKSNGAYTEAQIRGLVDMVEAYGMRGKVTWISFSSAFLGYVKAADPNARLGYLTTAVTSDAITTVQGLKTDNNEVYLGSSDYSADAVALCIAADIPLEVWTINSKSVIRNLDSYITGVTSDNLHAGRVLYNDAVNPVVTDALINIAMGTAGGSNNGTGGSAYAATMSGVSFDDVSFAINGKGYLTVPADFMATSDPWTIAFTIEAYTTNPDITYGRIARGNNDVPSIFYTNAYSAFQLKLANASLHTSNSDMELVDESFLTTLGGTGGLGFNFTSGVPTTFVFRNNGEWISLWVNGSEKVRQKSSSYTTSKYASTFSIGDNAGTEIGYLSYLKCSMLKAWNRGLTDEEIRIIS